MLSCLYQGHVRHHRREPDHSFSYPVWYAWINLDEIDAFCASSALISREAYNFFSFYRQDYLPGEGSLKNAAARSIKKQTGEDFNGQVYVLTTLRQLGFGLNPISLFYCYEASLQQPAYIIAEVHNTPWGERYEYVIKPDELGQAETVSKAFHVSPFMPMELEYQFDLPQPGNQIRANIKLLKQSVPVFSAGLDLHSLPLSAQSVRRILFASGWQSLKTVIRIYYQALRLWIKKATFYPHPKRRPERLQAMRKTSL